MIVFDDDLWLDGIAAHLWKHQRRTKQPTLMIIHTTRSGIDGRTAAQEYGSTINWFRSPNNVFQGTSERYAAITSYIVGGGQACRVLPEDRYPTYSLGHADPVGFSIEIGQATIDSPIEHRDLDNAARITGDICKRYNITPRMLPWLSRDNHEAPGIARHDRSHQGSNAGKTDPGPLFDEAKFIELVKRYMEDEMASEEYEELKKAQENMRRFFATALTDHEERLDKGQEFHDGIAVYFGAMAEKQGELAEQQRDHEGRIKKLETTE